MSEALVWLLVPLMVLAWLSRRAGLRMAELGFHGTVFGRKSVTLVTLLAIVFCWLSYTVFSEASGYAQRFLPEAGIFHYRSVIPVADPGRSMAILYFALSAGFVEEIYFRGLLLRIAMASYGSVALFLILSPLFFAAIHWESGMANVAAAYVYGLFAAVAYVWLRNIWPLVVGHVFTDCLMLTA
jgi:membrane protease YdiL (CAAX protease family)